MPLKRRSIDTRQLMQKFNLLIFVTTAQQYHDALDTS